MRSGPVRGVLPFIAARANTKGPSGISAMRESRGNAWTIDPTDCAASGYIFPQTGA